ncbi:MULTISPECIES: hypothetical protein [Rhodococcus]|uniref:hypothetical protein n=1 Tax=Rhodococcus TaxID=1827 RepID=UPI0029549A00|nr:MULTISPECIES: hypothetical protein [Rhodococcus]MDV7244458.1 hypothetical protein [Rhodococcus oxybenzonivorans]MDV7274299.1 hypothetical protein [Rhodococcus oxybenzonivorans]MDV7337815.1 hypothetical protein [Rhodococcus oxybenzonivorans]MDV7345249.1 hypothetical protein [Rhodococcus oxybenzonivorans]MDV8028937.1 hypothetical protein [Rhodococcus sp. IEGM 27]
MMRAWLSGDRRDLQELAELLSAGDTRVVMDDGDYYLTSEDIDHPLDKVPFSQAAARLLLRVNGLARAANADFRPVALAGRYDRGDASETILVVEDSIDARDYASPIVASAPDDAVPPSSVRPSAHSQLGALIVAHPEVGEALGLMGHQYPLGWAEMYKVYEIVRVSVLPRTIESLGWASKVEISSFTASANHPDVSGENARHARWPSAPPRRTMTVESSRQFIGMIVTSWLAYLRAQT